MTVNVETFCGECFFCRNGYVNNCTDPDGGWALGCRIDGGLAEYVRVPHADQGLNRIPDGVTDGAGVVYGRYSGHRLLGGNALQRSGQAIRCWSSARGRQASVPFSVLC